MLYAYYENFYRWIINDKKKKRASYPKYFFKKYTKSLLILFFLKTLRKSATVWLLKWKRYTCVLFINVFLQVYNEKKKKKSTLSLYINTSEIHICIYIIRLNRALISKPFFFSFYFYFIFLKRQTCNACFINR